MNNKEQNIDTRAILILINDILSFGINEHNLYLLINKCNNIIDCINNYNRKQYLYNMISYLEERSCSFVENDIHILEMISNIKKFLL